MIKNVILILGMHRSGTSAVTRSMNLLGASLPKTLLGANEGNARGHWESSAIIDSHDEMLQSLGSDWKDWRLLKPLIGTRKRKTLIDSMADLIEAEYAGQEIIVIKEPRICRFTSFYLDALESLGAKVHVILPSRNPIEVMQSLKKRDGLSPQDGFHLWLTHMLEAETDSRGHSRSFVDYAQFLSDPIKAINRIINDMPFKLPYSLDEAKLQITSFVNPGLQRELARPEDVTQHNFAQGWIAETYQAFLVLTGDANSKTALHTLDTIRGDYYPAIEGLQKLTKAFEEQLAGKDTELSKAGDALTAQANEHAVKWSESEAATKVKWDKAEAEAKAKWDKVEAETKAKWDAAEQETAAKWKAAQKDTDAQISSLKLGFDESYLKVKADAQAEIKTLHTDYTATIDTLKSDHASELSTAKADHAGAMQTLSATHTKAIEALKIEQEKLSETSEDRHAEALNKAASEHAAIFDELKSEHIKTVDEMKSQQGAQLEALRAEHATKSEAAERQQALALEALKAEQVDKIESLSSRHAAAINALNADHDNAVRALQGERDFMQNEFDAMLLNSEASLAEKETALAAAYHELYASKNRIKAMESSSSWRMTRGMRAIVNRLRGTAKAPKNLPEPPIPPRITDGR